MPMLEKWERTSGAEFEAAKTSFIPNRAGTTGSRERDAFESGIGKSSIWNQPPPSLEEPTPERLRSTVLVVTVDLALDFGLGLGAGGTYGTNFIGTERANEEMLKEVAILGVET